jgi:hypothetical protein
VQAYQVPHAHDGENKHTDRAHRPIVRVPYMRKEWYR